MPRTKIAFFADILIRNYDGCNRTIFHIIDRFDPEQYDIMFFSSIFPNEFKHKKVEIANIPIPFNTKYKMAFPILSKNKIIDNLNKFNPDVIHITTPSPLGFMALNYAKLNNIPTSTIYHTHYISYVKYYLRKLPPAIPFAENKFIDWTKKFYNNTNIALVPTQAMKEELINFGLDSKNMELWPRGLDKTVFNHTKGCKKNIQSITQNNKYNLLFASRLVWEKNLQLLINLNKLIQSKSLPYNIVIAGNGPAEKELKVKMPDAFYLGNLSQNKLSEIYASSDVFVFPSVSETFGNVVIEAMACGLPCVIANGGGSKAFIDHGVNGFLSKPYDAEEYLNYINTLIQNEDLRNSIIKNGIKYTNKYNWTELVDQLCYKWDSISTVPNLIAA